MPIICWGALGKASNDPTTIEEQIGFDIASHNANVSAHGLSGYAINVHRTDEALDHPDESVINTKIIVPARAFTAIVDADGDGDFTVIQDAVDFVAGEGGGRVLVRNGTYQPNGSIVPASGVSIIGESPLGVIVQFDEINTGFRAIGDASPYDTGTISITNGTDQVVGAGTSWDGNVIAGQYISLDFRWFEIKSVEDDTHLTVVNVYRGVTLAGEDYEAATFVSDIEVMNMTIEGVGFAAYNRFEYAVRCNFRNLHALGDEESLLQLQRSNNCGIFESDGFGTYAWESNDCYIDSNIMTRSSGNNFRDSRDLKITNNEINAVSADSLESLRCKRLFISGNTLRTGAGSPIALTDCEEIVVIGNYCFDGYQAILLDGSTKCRIIGNYCEGGNSVGIYLYNSSTHNVIEGNNIYNFESSGVTLGSGSDFNVVSNNVIKLAGVDGFFPGIFVVGADSNNIIGNICLDNTADGVLIQGSDFNVISGNQCKGNGSWGIRITSSASDKNIITSNQLLGNSSGALFDPGTATVKDNNVTA